MTYSEYKKIKIEYNLKLDELSFKLNSFPKLSNGLVSDETRQSIDFIETKKAYNFTFEQYRKFNSLQKCKIYAKQFQKEKRNNIKS